MRRIGTCSEHWRWRSACLNILTTGSAKGENGQKFLWEYDRSRLKSRKSLNASFFGSMPGSTVSKCTMTKVGKSDGKGTFARTRGNDKVAPIPAIRRLLRYCPGLRR